MIKINIVKNLFTRQISPDSCGTACLAMILRYNGRAAEANTVNRLTVPEGGLSLRDMQLLATRYGLSCRCVKMEVDFLRKLDTPVILHMTSVLSGDHFQVFFGYRRKKYMIADPGIQVHEINEAELIEKWQSGTALYFDRLEYMPLSHAGEGLRGLLRIRSYPVSLLIIIPLLSLFIAFFSIALTWLLQKGLADPELFQKHIIYTLLVFLFTICLFRNLFTFLRQYILIKINLNTNSLLLDHLVRGLHLFVNDGAILTDQINVSFGNIQKIQNAVSAFISVALSDGFLIFILLVSSCYALPYASAIDLVYIVIVLVRQINQLPDYLYQSSKTRLLSRASEIAFAAIIPTAGKEDDESQLSAFRSFYHRNLKTAQHIAIKLSQNYLLLECIGTVTLILVIIYTVVCYKKNLVSYESLLLVTVEAYLITVLMQRICTSVQQLGEGVDAYTAQFK